MTIIEIVSLLPLIIVSAATLIIMVMIAIKRMHFFTYILTLIAFAAAIISLSFISSLLPQEIGSLLLNDRYAMFFQLLIFGSGFIISVLSYDYLQLYQENREEFYILLMLASLGAALLTMGQHFASVFLGLELLSVSLYGMIAYVRVREKSVEAGVKYLILAAAAAAFILFGMALIYAGTGTMKFHEIAVNINLSDNTPGYVYAGISMVAGGIAFKLALAPFHMWTPDVYQGASAMVSGFIAAVSKGAVFALLLRIFTIIELKQHPSVEIFFIVIAFITMFTGNILALLQQNVKRLLAYSSIAHLGYLLVAFIAGTSTGMKAAAFYLFAYMVTILGAFGIISIFSSAQNENEVENIDGYKGLFWQKPGLAVIFTGVFLSLAGIPLTTGFFGKFYIALAGINAGYIGLVIVLAVNTVIGIYYYLKVITALFSHPSADATAHNITFPLRSIVMLTVLFALLVWYGIFPSGLITFIGHFVAF